MKNIFDSVFCNMGRGQDHLLTYFGHLYTSVYCFLIKQRLSVFSTIAVFFKIDIVNCYKENKTPVCC